MTNLSRSTSHVNTAAILEASGYRIRGKRADCPNCEGHSRLTVSFTDDGRFYCHRCSKGGHVAQLAFRLQIALPPPRIAKARIRKEEFKRWLSLQMTQMANEEHELVKLWRYGLDLLEFAKSTIGEPPNQPQIDWAWTQIANYYDEEQRFLDFWQRASDRIGRFGLYRKWRRRHVR